MSSRLRERHKFSEILVRLVLGVPGISMGVVLWGWYHHICFVRSPRVLLSSLS